MPVDSRVSGIKWIFFDWGGTLKDEIAIYRKLTEVIVTSLKKREVFIDEARMYNRLIELERSDEQSRPQRAMAEFGCGPGDVAAVMQAIETEFSMHPAPSYESAAETLEKLRERFRLGIISNHRAGLDLRLQMDTLGSYFNVAVGSGDVGVQKPDIRIFEMAMDRAGCAASEAVMVGDRLNKDIAGANRVGMYSVRIKQGIYADDEPTSPDEEADATISEIREMLDLFI